MNNALKDVEIGYDDKIILSQDNLSASTHTAYSRSGAWIDIPISIIRSNEFQSMSKDEILSYLLLASFLPYTKSEMHKDRLKEKTGSYYGQNHFAFLKLLDRRMISESRNGWIKFLPLDEIVKARNEDATNGINNLER